MNGALIVEKRGYQDSRKKDIFSVSPAAFPSSAWATEHYEDSDHAALITRSPLSDNFIECSGWRRPLSSSTLMLTASIAMSGGDILERDSIECFYRGKPDQ
jgi:hypothetical protein